MKLPLRRRSLRQSPRRRPPEQQQAEAARPPEINPAEDLEYQVETTAQPDSSDLGMVEVSIDGVCGEDEDNPPER